MRLPFNRFHVCVNDPQSPGPGVCNGDSGGPLACKDEDRGGKYVLRGVAGFVAREEGCGTEIPDGFAAVAPHVEWIRETMDYR